jgi:hypothetical protein
MHQGMFLKEPTVTCITLPLTSRINQQHLRGQLLPNLSLMSVQRKMHPAPVDMFMSIGNWSPGELAVIAAVMQRRCTCGASYDWEIGLVFGSVNREGVRVERASNLRILV